MPTSGECFSREQKSDRAIQPPASPDLNLEDDVV